MLTDLEKLNPEPEVADVETPKSAAKFSKNIAEHEESPKPNANNDRPSNYSSKNNTERMEFNGEKIIDKVIHRSSQDTSEMETVSSEDNPRQTEGPQQAPHQWGRPKLWDESQRDT